ncbi:hypothetical protein G7Y89_g6998 [Cudoniella acicularis]|uniref:AMP-dependent synthetase/ligase domain-containing protein n=1 Tax=Cudoniella acicularis TaxID=354080 RepID=A0A8H4RLZ1_9HELO|nr:hypothetical protein G7Y89_g6998 [Cudoniella acicularis]
MPTLQFSEDLSPPRPHLQRKQLLNHIIDGLAQVRPESIWAKIPNDMSSYDAGYRKITYKMMANAINGMAWWIKSELGVSQNFETLAYFGTWDPRYIILLLGAVKAGYKMIFPSPNYAVTGLTTLLDQLGCKIILASSKQLDIVSRLSKGGHKQFYEIPSLTKLLDEPHPHFSFNKTFDAAQSEPLVVVHTSGTTGTPKPLIYTHDWVASWIEMNQTDPPAGYTSLEHMVHGIEICAVTPPNHSSSLLPNLFAAVPNQMVVLFPLPKSPLTFETAMEMIRCNSPDLLLAPAHVLDGIASDVTRIQEVSTKVSMISFGGGPLSKSTGDILTQHFRLFGMYGTSEMGTIHKIVPYGTWDSRTWNSWKPHPGDNIEFRRLQDDSYEAIVHRNNAANGEQPVFKLFPDLQEWSTRDMFSPDPHREGFWAYRGRVDDLIILNNGGTINPSGYEEKISSVPFVSQAIMYGTGMPHPALLVEVFELQGQEASDLMDELWAAVVECNQIFPPQSSISRSRIMTTTSSKPLPRSAKGMVQRGPALELYREELNQLYD